MASIEPSKLDRMKRSFENDAALDEVFIVLSICAGLINSRVTRQQPRRRDRGDGRGSMDHAAKSRRFCRAFW